MKNCQTFSSSVMMGKQSYVMAAKSPLRMCEPSFRAASVHSTGISTAWTLLLLFRLYSRIGGVLYTLKRSWPRSVHLHQLIVSEKSKVPRLLCQLSREASRTTGILRWIGATSLILNLQTIPAGQIPTRSVEPTSYQLRASCLILLSSKYSHLS